MTRDEVKIGDVVAWDFVTSYHARRTLSGVVVATPERTCEITQHAASDSGRCDVEYSRLRLVMRRAP